MPKVRKEYSSGISSEALYQTLTGGYFSGGDIEPNINRMADRVFVGGAIKSSGEQINPGDTDWLTTTVDQWPMVNAQLGVQQTNGRIGVMGASRSSDFATAGTTVTIGVAGFVVNDGASDNAWGLYSDLQHESGANWSAGLEVAAKNKGSDLSETPNTSVGGVYGLWLAGGGDNSYGGASANPSNAAMVILKNSNTWNRGIVFMKDALTAGEAVSLSSEGTGGAHSLTWYNAAGNKVFDVLADTSDTDRWKIMRVGGGIEIRADNMEVATFAAVSSAINHLNMKNAVAGNPPILSSIGDDTNIDLQFTPKGSGVVQFGTHTGLAAETVSGYITIKDSGGTSRKVAVVS